MSVDDYEPPKKVQLYKQTKIDNYYTLTGKHAKLLEIYAETLDIDKARKEAGLRLRDWKRLAQKSWFKKEIDDINRLFKKQYMLKVATGKHLDLMDKFEKQHDRHADDNPRAASSYASTLAKMSEASMCAGGHFKESEEYAGPGITVNINIGDSNKTVDVTPEDDTTLTIDVEDEND